MSRPIPNVTLGGFRPNQVKINSIGIGIDDDTLNSLNLNSDQYMVVGGQINDVYNMIVDSEGVIVNSSIVNRASHSNEYALFVDGNIFVTGKVDTSAGTLSNIAGGGGSGCNYWFPVTNDVAGSTNIFYDGKINIANEAQSRSNAYRVNIIDNANKNITHAQLAIQNQVGGIARMGILGYSNLSPVVINSSKGPIEFHANRDSSYFNSVYYRYNPITSNTDALNLPYYASNSVAPHLAINRDGTIGIKASPNIPLTYTLRTVDGGNPNIIVPTTITNTPADLQVNGTSYSCNMLIFDYESRQVKNIDDLYVRKLGVTLAASQIEPGSFAPGNYTFLSNLSIGGPIEAEYHLSVYGKTHIYDQLYADKAVLSSNLTVQNTFEVLGTSYFENDVIVNDNLQVNENLIIWGGFYADKNNLYTFVPGANNNNTLANIQFVNYIANGWSNIYLQGAGFITPGAVGIGINNQYDQTPSQLSVISRDSNIYALSLFDKTNENVIKSLFVGHQRSNIINDTLDASVIFATPSSTSPYFSFTQTPCPQNIYFYPGQYDKTLNSENMVNNSNAPTFSIYETGQVAVNSFQPNAATQLYVKGSIGFTSNLYTRDTVTGNLTKLAQFKYVPVVGLTNDIGITYNDSSAPHIGINTLPNRDYGVILQGGLSADTYYNGNDQKGYLWLDTATNNNDTTATTANGVYILSKVGIGENTPQYLLDLCADNENIGNDYGTYIRLSKSTIEGQSNTGIRFDGTLNPWFTNVESISTNISQYAIGSASDVYTFGQAYNISIPIYGGSNYSNVYLTSSNINYNISYNSPIYNSSNLSIGLSNIVNTYNITYTYNLTFLSNLTSNITSNVSNISGYPIISSNISLIISDYVSLQSLSNITTTSNYDTPSAPTSSNIIYTSNVINTSNILNTSNVFNYLVNTSNYLNSSNNNGLLIHYDSSRGSKAHQIVLGGNSYLVDKIHQNPNPNPYATLTVNGDTSILGDLNVTGRITANNTVTVTTSGRSNVPSIEQDDLFISGKDIYFNPTNKLYLNYTETMRNYSVETTSKAVLNVYQDIDNPSTPAPIAHFVGEGANAFIEIFSKSILTASGGVNDGILRIGLLNGDATQQVMGIQDSGGYPYMSFKKLGNTKRAMGINTATPSAQLHITNDYLTLNNNMLRITYDNGNSGDTENYTPNIILEKKYNEDGIAYKQWIIEGPVYGTGLNDQLAFKYIKINTTGTGDQIITSNNVLSITSNGCIGINNTNPTYLIDVVSSNLEDGRNHGMRLWNKMNMDTAQLIFQAGDASNIGGDIYADYIMYSCNSEFIFKQRNSLFETEPLFYFASNTNLGIRTTPNNNYNVNIGGKLNVSDSIYINDKIVFSSSDFSATGFVITGSNNVYLKPNVTGYGGVVINGVTPTSNLFHIYNDGTGSPNMTVYDSILNRAELNLRNKETGAAVFNLYKLYSSNNNFGLRYQQTNNRSVTLPINGWNDAFQLSVATGTSDAEHDMTLYGNIHLQSDVRGFPKISFGSNGEIGGNNTHGSLYILPNAGSNVGVGTTIPAAPLHVYGNTYMGQGFAGSNASTVGGPFFKQHSWDTAGGTHTITYPSYCVGDNSTGMIYIQVSNKIADSGTTKIGNIQASFIKPYGNDAIISQIASHKNTNLSSMSITNSGSDIVVTTDSDCYISWTSIGSY